jgi:hypothetical protein
MPRRYLVVLMILAVTALVPAVVVPLVLSDDPSTDQDPVAGGSPSATLPTTATGTPSAATTSPVPINVAVSATKPGEGDPGFTTLVYEAEDGRLRQAEVVALDGGAGVRFTGESGEIEFESVDVPRQDRYRVTIVYAAEGEWSIVIRGSANRERVQLPRNAGCCASVTESVRIGAGGRLTIELARGDGPFPTIDRILIDAT